jgi:hypothetical protein
MILTALPKITGRTLPPVDIFCGHRRNRIVQDAIAEEIQRRWRL